ADLMDLLRATEASDAGVGGDELHEITGALRIRRQERPHKLFQILDEGHIRLCRQIRQAADIRICGGRTLHSSRSRGDGETSRPAVIDRYLVAHPSTRLD